MIYFIFNTNDNNVEKFDNADSFDASDFQEGLINIIPTIEKDYTKI